MYVKDNYDFFEDHERELEKRLRHLPECACCGEKICSDYKYNTVDGWVCEECLNDYYRERIDDD